MLCASYLFIIICYYLFVLVICYCCSFILFIVRLFIHLVPFCYSSILLFSSFILHCSKEKSSILILDCVPGISILHTTSSIRVNKHHTADSTDFVLVLERRTYYDHRHSGIDETNIPQVDTAVEGETFSTYMII